VSERPRRNGGAGGIADIAAEALRASREGPPVVVVTVIRAPRAGAATAGAKLLVRSDGSRLGSLGGGALEDAAARDALDALNARPRRAVTVAHYTPEGVPVSRRDAASDAVEVMIEVVEPPVTLLIVGAGHIGQALCAFAARTGFSVAVLDDREEFANRERLPEADAVLCGDIAGELRRFRIDANTYVVLVSRGHRQDEVALREVVGRGAAYVGMIGSRRRVETVLRHLAAEGFDRAALDAVRTPIGLDIGAETPEEIAISILAEVIMARRGGTGRPMSERRRSVGAA
jgi:xanthine dehydrogenase accessory factor